MTEIERLKAAMRRVLALAKSGSYDDGSMLDDIEDIASQALEDAPATDDPGPIGTMPLLAKVDVDEVKRSLSHG